MIYDTVFGEILAAVPGMQYEFLSEEVVITRIEDNGSPYVWEIERPTSIMHIGDGDAATLIRRSAGVCRGFRLTQEYDPWED